VLRKCVQQTLERQRRKRRVAPVHERRTVRVRNRPEASHYLLRAGVLRVLQREEITSQTGGGPLEVFVAAGAEEFCSR
jgi:hypothetical protein